MDKALKRKWVKALRSGKYEQGSGCLHDSVKNTYCCLGVLGLIVKTHFDELNFGGYLKAKVLPSAIQRKLASLNDRRVPFEVIAGFIQENL